MGQIEVVNFLRENKGKKFRTKEIAENIDGTTNTVSSVMKRLRKGKMVNFYLIKESAQGLYEYWYKEG